MARSGLFIYGFVKADEDKSLGQPGVEYGGVKGDVRIVTLEGAGAVVSDYPAREKVMPTRKNLDAHNKVIREWSTVGSIIPMSFGQVVRGEAELKKFLKKNKTSILRELGRLDNKVEMTLKVRWDVENIFDYFVREDRELAEARDRVFRRSSAPTQAEKMELGRLFEERLTEERNKHTEQVVDLIRKSASDVKVNAPKGEKTVLDIVALVDRQKVQQFEKKVYEVAEAYPNQYTFDFNGPWAPFSFVELNLQSGA